jgi:hypothetical protein
LLLGLVLLLLGTGTGAARGAILDANCPGPASGNHAVNSDKRRAQTFTAQHTGAIIGTRLEIHSFAGGSLDFQLQILGTDAYGVPIEGILARAAIPAASVPEGNFTLQGSFQPPAQVTAGKQYALVATRGQPFDVRPRIGNPCPGQEYSSTSGGPFTPFAPGNDLVFQIEVEPSNDFSVKSRVGRTLTLSVPNAGTVALAPGAQPRRAAAAKKRRPLLRPYPATPAGPGDVIVSLRLTKAGKLRLRQKGKLRIPASVTYQPTGGEPKTVGIVLRFKRHRK